MTEQSKKLIIEALEALADKCTRLLLHPEQEMDPLKGMSHKEARSVRDLCLTALNEVEQIPVA